MADELDKMLDGEEKAGVAVCMMCSLLLVPMHHLRIIPHRQVWQQDLVLEDEGAVLAVLFCWQSPVEEHAACEHCLPGEALSEDVEQGGFATAAGAQHGEAGAAGQRTREAS